MPNCFALTEERDALWEVEEPDPEQEARSEALSERIDELEDRLDFWPREILAIAGAVVSLDHNGEVKITAGLVKPEDAPPKSRQGKGENSDPSEASPFAAALIESLTAQRSAALAAVLLERPDIALAATVHALAAQVFYGGSQNGMALQIGVTRQSLHRVENARAHGAIENAVRIGSSFFRRTEAPFSTGASRNPRRVSYTCWPSAPLEPFTLFASRPSKVRATGCGTLTVWPRF